MIDLLLPAALSHSSTDDSLLRLDVDFNEGEVRHDIRVPVVPTRRMGVVADEAVYFVDLISLAAT